MPSINFENRGRVFFLTPYNFDDVMSWLRAIITWPIIILTPMCHIYSESWVHALSHSLGPILVEFFFKKFLRRSKRSKKMPFLHLLRASPSGRQSDNFDASRLPNTSFESYAPNFSGNMLKLVRILKFGVPPFCEVSLSGFRAPLNSCFKGIFFGENCFSRPNRPISTT